MDLIRNNEYYLIENGIVEIDFNKNYNLGWGFDYYIDIFRLIEKQGSVSGIKFLLSYNMPKIPPPCDDRTVLFVLADEKYIHTAYLNKLLCIFRCIGSRPIYLDGLPNSSLKRAALIHFLYKSYGRFRSILQAAWQPAGLHILNVKRKTKHIPLGIFRAIESNPLPISVRKNDFAFLGSINFDNQQKRWFHRFFRSPKILSREQMLEYINKVDISANRKIWVASAMEESIKNHDEYVDVMFNTKISIVPRGTSYESFRFFESAKAGCVIICEKLPAEWCYENHPGIEITNWKQLPRIVAELLNDPELLERKSMDALRYWENRCSEKALASYISQCINHEIEKRNLNNNISNRMV